MQKYYAQDDENILKATDKRQTAVFQKNLQEILTPFRERFEQNILVVSSLREKDDQKALVDFFEQNLKNCGLYFLQPKDAGQFVCVENFSGVKFDLKDTAALSDFVKNYKIAGIFVENPLNFGDNLSLISGWLKTCELPMKVFAQKTK